MSAAYLRGASRSLDSVRTAPKSEKKPATTPSPGDDSYQGSEDTPTRRDAEIAPARRASFHSSRQLCRMLVFLTCVEINQCVGCTRQFSTNSSLGDGAAVLAAPTATPSCRRRLDGVAGDARRRTASGPLGPTARRLEARRGVPRRTNAVGETPGVVRPRPSGGGRARAPLSKIHQSSREPPSTRSENTQNPKKNDPPP